MFEHTREFPLIVSPTRAGRSTSRIGAAAAVIVVASSVWATSAARRATPVMDERTQVSAPSLFASVGHRQPHNARYHAEVVATTAIGTDRAMTWTVRLTGSDERVIVGARLAVETSMPETGARSRERAMVREVGEGLYRVDGITFSRPGWWNVALAIDAAAGGDSLAFNVVLPSAARGVRR